MVKVGLTGGIGSGKTTVCGVWEQLGAYAVNADDIAKKIMVTDEAVKKKLVDTFGEQVYQDNGSLNREFLATEAFEKGRVGELNRIVHPYIPDYVCDEFRTAEEHGYPLVVYEAILLLEGLDSYRFDYIAMVLAESDKRLEWARERDREPEHKIRKRMKQQPDFGTLTDSADFVVCNGKSLAELEQKAKDLYIEILNNQER